MRRRLATAVLVFSELLLDARGAQADARGAQALLHEVYVRSGFTYYGSPSRVMAGAGGGVGYRFHFAPAFAAYGEAQYLAFVGQFGVLSLGAMWHPRVAIWEPMIGLHGTLLFGDQVRVVTPQEPDPPGLVTWAAQVRVAPLRFTRGAFAASALGVDFGLGADQGGLAKTFSLSILEIGLRF